MRALYDADDEDGGRAPYEVSADGLEAAILDAQLARLNPIDRRLARAHLRLAPPAEVHPLAPNATEKAMTKLRHPSVASIWKLSGRKPAPPGAEA